MSSFLKKIIGKVENGKLQFDDAIAWHKNLLDLNGHYVWITIDRFSQNRTLPQNKYYWAVPVKLLSECWGYTKDEAHDILRRQFLTEPGENGKPDKIRSTTSLSTQEFNEYIEHIQMWAIQEFGVYIPDPNEVVLN